MTITKLLNSIFITILCIILFIPFALTILFVTYFRDKKFRRTGYKVCWYCFGSGVVHEKHFSLECPHCDGHGKIDWIKAVIH